MSAILQHDAAAELVDVISSACNDESVKATLANDDILHPSKPTTTLKIPAPNDEDVDEIDINDTSYSSLEDYAGSEKLSSPTTDSGPLPLTHVRPALSKLTAAARLIDLLSASYDAEDARDLLGDTDAWHSFEDSTETIDDLYDRYRTVLYEFADAVAGQQQDEHEEGAEVSAEAYREGMQALARVLRGSCDPLPYRLRQVHVALVGGNGGESKGGAQHRDVVRQVEEEARVLLRAANDRCIEEADDFLAYYVTVRRLFLHLVASEAKAVMIMAVALQHGAVPHYIHPSDITTARQLLAEQDGFLDRTMPSPVVRLAERVLTAASPTCGDSDAPAGVAVIIQTRTGREVRPSAGEGPEVICAGGNGGEEQQQRRPFVWRLEAAGPLPKEDGDAVGRYTFHLRSGGPAHLGCDDQGDMVHVASEGRPSGTWRIAAVQVEEDARRHGGKGKAAPGAAMAVAFRLQYRRADGGRGDGKWLAWGGDDGRLGVLKEVEGDGQASLFDIRPVDG